MSDWQDHRDALAAESQRLRDEAYADQLTPPEPEKTWEQQEQERMIANISRRNLPFGGGLEYGPSRRVGP